MAERLFTDESKTQENGNEPAALNEKEAKNWPHKSVDQRIKDGEIDPEYFFEHKGGTKK